MRFASLVMAATLVFSKWAARRCPTVQTTSAFRPLVISASTRAAAERRHFVGPTNILSKRNLLTQLRAISISSEGVVRNTHVETQEDAFDVCWSSDCWSINEDDNPHIDQVLQALLSPAPQSYYVFQRALTTATSWKRALQACYFLVKADYQIVLRQDLAPKDRCTAVGVDWNAIPVNGPPPKEGWVVVPRPEKFRNGIQIAKKALALVEEASEQQQSVDEHAVDSVVRELREHLQLTLGTDIRGRTCADTAFTLGLAGVTDTDLYDTLSKITRLELERVGRRKSRRGKDILQIVEKLAASGVSGGDAERAFRVAADCLAEKGPQLDPGKDDLATPLRFGLLSQRPLIWLWRYSASLAKPKVKVEAITEPTASSRWIEAFEDNTRPLVVDVGCGLGVSLLGLSSFSKTEEEKEGYPGPLGGTTKWSDCNFIGGDLSLATTRFARGIAHRWGLSDRLQYAVCSTEILLKQVLENYPGQTALILVQFPTPYRLDDDPARTSVGNTQLPSNVESGFMINQAVLSTIASILTKQEPSRNRARLLVQSNCEDVAVTIRDMAQSVGLACVEASVARITTTNNTDVEDALLLPQRTQKWIQRGGERALGPEWWAHSVLPPKCATETEVACDLKQTAIHRCLFELP